ncbi:hypothetical protein BDN72DRAFT_896436 [Pluteus cervinus]|uniref:Uncharacterized protein n=1 Tax=Pluteus cervinus TaxID=181527 RepID=A0ACD3AYQ8_9AGAR|nr:hypothetical protein BDN72DRAFT_896436 [Pluteus cervinus]
MDSASPPKPINTPQSIPHPQQTVPTSQSTMTSTLSRFTSFRLPKKDKAEWPPPHWDLENSVNNGIGATTEPGQLASAPGATPPNSPESGTATSRSMEPSVDRATLAKRLSHMIETLPMLSPEVMSVTTTDEDGPPVPSMVDEQLMEQLTSENVMNGSGGLSVWSMLQRLGQKKPVEGHVDVEGSDFMVYAPLEPAPDAEPQLAESETVLEYFDDPRDKPTTFETSKMRKTKHWVPSTTQLSLQTLWWGYRLYLPPPVMAVLNDHRIKTAQRSAMLTTALLWLLNHIPSMVIPPQFRPAVKILKKSAPILGGVGTVVTAAWKRIEKQDKGNGVVLTATWVLPVALIPMAWNAGDIYGPALPPPAE